ncbi:MAG: hypothetical protein PHO08_13780 [Methylococcales bacterium]|nr:hypothetical protein [Methylococcales bacterium]
MIETRPGESCGGFFFSPPGLPRRTVGAKRLWHRRHALDYRHRAPPSPQPGCRVRRHRPRGCQPKALPV